MGRGKGEGLTVIHVKQRRLLTDSRLPLRSCRGRAFRRKRDVEKERDEEEVTNKELEPSFHAEKNASFKGIKRKRQLSKQDKIGDSRTPNKVVTEV